MYGQAQGWWGLTGITEAFPVSGCESQGASEEGQRLGSRTRGLPPVVFWPLASARPGLDSGQSRPVEASPLFFCPQAALKSHGAVSLFYDSLGPSSSGSSVPPSDWEVPSAGVMPPPSDREFPETQAVSPS